MWTRNMELPFNTIVLTNPRAAIQAPLALGRPNLVCLKCNAKLSTTTCYRTSYYYYYSYCYSYCYYYYY